MFRLDKVIKPWKESAALNAHINLYGFWNHTTFLTKSGDVGMVLRVTGVDYESLDRSEQEYAVKRLEANTRCCGRRSQILLDAGDLRGLSAEMDSSALASLPADGREGCGSGEMAEEPLLSENRDSTGTWQQSENPKHYECALFPRDALGMGGQESHHQRSSECKTAEVARHSDAGRDHGIPQGAARSAADHDRTGCLHGSASWRTDRSSMAGCGFRKSDPACSLLARGDGGRSAENGSVSQRRSVRCANSGVAVGPRRLGVRLPAYKGEATLLAGNAVAVLRKTGLKTRWGDEASFVSHIPAHVRNAFECQRRKPQGCSGTAASRESEGHDRRLHAGGQPAEARSTGQLGPAGEERRGFGSCVPLSGSNWIMKKNGGFAELLYFVGVPDGI